MAGAKKTARKKAPARNSAKKNSPKSAAVAKKEEKPKRFSSGPINRLRLVRQMIRKLASDATGKDGSKSGVAELIRLIGLERELAVETENVREIKVTWVEPAATEQLSGG